MSTIHRIISGDTFESISRVAYGTELEASRIAKANPGVNEPLTIGVNITIPVLPDAPKNLQQNTPSDDIDEVAILIDGKRFRFWDKVQISRVMDSIHTVDFSAPFNSTLPEFRETFKPFTYKSIVVTVGGSPIFTGVMVGILPMLENGRVTVTVNCYSIPGVLNDCTPPASSFPLEFNDQGLQEITKTLTASFGINVVFEAEQGAIFDTVSCDAGKKILSFLSGLTKQRNLILSNDSKGSLLVTQAATTGKPVAKLTQGESPLLSVSPAFGSQQYYSHITGIEPVIVGLKGSQFTVKNPRLEGIVRPLTFIAPDTIDSTVKSATEAKAGRMFGNLVSYNIQVSTWRDSSGKLWADNTTLILIAPDAMIYKEYEFIIRSVVFEKDRNTKIATLNLVIPESFLGKIPEVLPWDE